MKDGRFHKERGDDPATGPDPSAQTTSAAEQVVEHRP